MNQVTPTAPMTAITTATKWTQANERTATDGGTASNDGAIARATATAEGATPTEEATITRGTPITRGTAITQRTMIVAGAAITHGADSTRVAESARGAAVTRSAESTRGAAVTRSAESIPGTAIVLRTETPRGVLDRAEVAAWAAGAVQRGRMAWPELEVSAHELAQLVERRRALPGREIALEDLDAAELYLAAACARGDDLAVRRFRARYFEPLLAHLRRMGVGSAQCDDVWQTLCERLLVATGDGPPGLVRYAGGGELGGLLRVAVTRLAINGLHDQGRSTREDWLHQMPGAQTDPEVQLSRQQHRAEIKQEVAAALATLPARDRMVLRLHLVERLGIDAIAGVASIHRATAARWLARAKDTLALRVRDRLLARWRVSHASLPALRTVLDSQIDLSLERLLPRD